MSNRESSSRPWYVRWGISFAVGLVIAFAVACARGVFRVSGAARVWRILCDGCFVSAVLLMGVGLMTLVSSEGMFDIVSYGFLCLRSTFQKGEKRGKRLPGGESEENGERATFYDYKVAKRGTRSTHWYLLFVGLIFLAGAFFCLCMFEWVGGLPLG